MNKKKLLEKVLSGTRNLRFDEFVALAVAFGFEESRTRGSHHTYKRAGVVELVNIQNCKGQAKPYQVRQLIQIVEQYNLTLGDDE